MSKLLEQVKEIQQRAHRCPECKGQKTVIMAGSDGWTLEEADCVWCDGKGEVPAPDIDKLVGIIEVLERYVEANFEMGTHECECASCEFGDRCYEGNLLWIDRAHACTKADVLVLKGLPDEE